MVQVIDVISKIENYKTKIKDRAFPDSQPIDLVKAENSVKYLHDLLKNNSGDSLTFTDYDQLKKYTEAVSILETYSKLQSLTDIKKQGGISYAELEKAMIDWEVRGKYITLPVSFRQQAFEMIKPYYEMTQKLPPAKRMLAERVLKNFSDPVGLFNRAKDETINQINLMMENVKEKHIDKGAMVANVYWDKLNKSQSKYLYDFQTWLNHGVDSKYLFTAANVENTLSKVLEGRVASIKAKHKADVAKEDADAKKNDEFRESSIKSLKAARNDAENQFQDKKDENFKTMVREALGVTDRATHDFNSVQTLFNETQNLTIPPEPSDFIDLETKALAARQEILTAQSQVKSTIDSLTKTT